MDDRPSEVAVLLVDDDVDWVETTGAALERADGALSVITATGGWEALELLEGGHFDCVVCDYRMPDFDGIALLERIRAEYGDVPFILVTGGGSEAVASRAISSRVTDYFIKEPGRDQSRALARRVRTAVEAHRTERALAAARERFRGLFENVPDPVVVVDGTGAVRAVNPAFADAFGVDREAVVGATLDAVAGGADADGPAPADGPAVRQLSTETEEGTREFIVRRFRLGEADPPEFGHVFTDVTLHRERERELERFYELASEVRELVLSAGSREELERGFCETVVSSVEGSCSLIVGGSDADDLRVEASAGDVHDRVEAALLGLDVDAGGGHDVASTAGDRHPLVGALATGEPRYVPDVADDDGEWSSALQASGVREVLAVPIQRAGLPAGVFVVCSRSRSRLEGAVGDRLVELAASLGDAMDMIDRAAALTAERAVRVRVSIADDRALSNEIAGAADAPIDAVAAVPHDDATSLYVDVAGVEPDAARSRIEAVEGVLRADVVGSGERARLRVDVPAPTLLATLAEHGAALCAVRAEGGTTTATFDVPVSGDVRAIVSAIEAEYDAVTLGSIRNVGRGGDGPGEGLPLGGLTGKQRRALRTAFHEGYFERPRLRSADEVAATLGVSRSTFLQHLRAAERKLLEAVLDAGTAGGEE